MEQKQKKKYRRVRRIRGKIKGTSNRSRLSVFRSNKHISAQIIDDNQGKTLISFNDSGLKIKKKMTKTEIAREVGQEIAKQALKKEIKQVVFDRGKYRYHGRVKALAEGARKGGLKF